MTSVLKVDTLQNLNSSTIITQTNATTLTLGTSGQTISIPAGATINTSTLNVTTVVLAAGAVGTPSLTTSGDTNTGIFFPSADTIAFTEGGTEAMRINSSGDVGIGTVTPTERLQVVDSRDDETGILISNLDTGTAARGQIRVESDSANGFLTAVSSTNTTAALGGRVSGVALLTGGGNSAGGISILARNAAGIITLHTGGDTERMRIDSTGNVSITQTPGKYTIDTTPGATSIANGGTIDFLSASGMLVVNNHINGAVTIYLCGGGQGATVGSVIAQVGTFTFATSPNRYVFTNNSGSTATFGFFFVRTRPGA